MPWIYWIYLLSFTVCLDHMVEPLWSLVILVCGASLFTMPPPASQLPIVSVLKLKGGQIGIYHRIADTYPLLLVYNDPI